MTRVPRLVARVTCMAMGVMFLALAFGPRVFWGVLGLTFEVYAVLARTPKPEPKPEESRLATSPDGAYLYVYDPDAKLVKVIETENWTVIQTISVGDFHFNFNWLGPDPRPGTGAA